MSGREWQPGDVAAITFDNASRFQRDQGHSNVVTRIVVRGDGGWGRGLHRGLSLDQVRDLDAEVRPLVVIDPEDREQVERLVRWYYERFAQIPGAAVSIEGGEVDALQAALREFANPTPPKPAEPTGLGAVVEDAEGRLWVYTGDRDSSGAWWLCRDEPERWSEISAVRILSEGVPS